MLIRISSKFWVAGLTLVIACAGYGCSQDSTQTGTPGDSSSGDEATSPEQVVVDEVVDVGPVEAQLVEAEPVEMETIESLVPAETAADTDTVLLGTPELTAGIPGDGPLSVQQVQQWLAAAENHVTLRVTLPLGLSAGQSQIQGLDENPLTRAKIELGRQLYFDKRLSADNTVSCADCHHPDEGYGRHTQFGVGINDQTGNRNSPVSHSRILSGAQFWDGRAASLEEQAVGPIANPIEMGNTHEKAVETVKGIEGYRLQFEKVFPDEGVTIDTIGKAIASFERVIVAGTSPFDHYEVIKRIESQYDAEELQELKDEDPQTYARYAAAREGSKEMSENAKRGHELFFSDRGGCTACHVGANFTDEKYHNLGVGMDQKEPDLGRFEVTKAEEDRGAFKTPTLRNIEHSAPYMHDGSQQTLEEVVEWYDKGGHPNPQLSKDVKKLNLSPQDEQDLVAFMKSLTGPFPEVEMERLPE